jgi:hypothetical protein
MGLPPESVESSPPDHGFAASLRRCLAVERSMNAMKVVVVPEFVELSLQVPGVPE